MKIAIMQPYIFPYIGYFHLIESVDKFIFYDDVNFIKKGWINRNRILFNNQPFTFTIPLLKISQNKLIKDIYLYNIKKQNIKFIQLLRHSYSKAPRFKEILNVIQQTLQLTETNQFISDLAINSILNVYSYLGKTFKYDKSSIVVPESKLLDGVERIINITQSQKCSIYNNTIGGMGLYNKKQFEDHNISLNFVKTKQIHYKQFNDNFIPNLSIIDVLMFNDISSVKDILQQFTLV